MQIPTETLLSMRNTLRPRIGIVACIATAVVAGSYFHGSLKAWAERIYQPATSAAPVAPVSCQLKPLPAPGNPPMASRDPCPGCGGG